MSLLVRPAPPLSPFKAAGLRWEVGGDEALTCRYEVLKYKHMKRHDYFPGIESTEFPECYSEFMTKKEWREKINRINKEILAWWSPGNRVRNASYMLGTVCLLVPCLLVYCAMDEVGYFCFVNRKRKQLRDVLGPVCEGLSDENLVWAVEYRRRPQDEAKGPDNEQAENSKAVYVVISRRGMGPARDPMALESDKTPPDTSRVSDEESAGSRGQLTTPPHAVHPERAHSPAGVVSEQPRSPAGDSSPFLPRIGSSNRVLPDPGLGAGEGPGNQRAEPADKSDVEDDSLHSGASASNLLAEVEDLVADLSSKEPQPARPASGAPADVSHAADVTDNSADFADLPDVVDSATATGEAGGLLSELHDMLILSGRGMDSPTDPMGNAAAEGTAQPNYYSMMDDDDIDDAVIQNLSLNDGQSYEQVSARKDEAADAVESFSPADRSQDSVDAFLPRAARGPALSPHASSPQLADLLRGAGEAPPAGNETPTRPVDFPERQSPLELPSLQGASWPSVHEEEEKPTSATLALEAYSAQAPMDDGYAEEDYVHMTSEPNPVPAAAVESPPQYTEDIDGRRPSIDLSDLLGDDWDGDARSPLSNNDFADNTMNVSQGSSLPPLYAQSSDARQPSLDLSDLLGDDWEGNTRPPRSKTDSAVGTPEVEKQFILPEDATPLAQWSQKDYGSGKQNIESQDFSDWLNDIDNILGEGGAGKEDTVSPARAVAPSLSSPPVTTGFRRSPNPEMTPFL